MSRTKHRNNSNSHLKWIRLIHSYSAMAVLVSMLFFAFTGITLNHRDWFPSNSQETFAELPLPAHIFNPEVSDIQPMIESESLRDWLTQEHGLEGKNIRVDWDDEEQLLMLDVKKPGGYTVAEVDVEQRTVILEQRSYGVVATLNDLHMGRNAGSIWALFIDISSVAMLLFSLTGLWLVLPQKRRKNKLFGVGAFGCAMMFGFYWLAY